MLNVVRLKHTNQNNFPECIDCRLDCWACPHNPKIRAEVRASLEKSLKEHKDTWKELA